MGKPTAALLDGSLKWFGSYELCTKDVHVNYTYYNRTYMDPGQPTELRRFAGEYCQMGLQSAVGGPLQVNFFVPLNDLCKSWTKVLNLF